MGGLGSDAAIEAADIVIMDDKPSKLLDLMKISKQTLSIVKQNILFALVVKLLVLVLSALGLANMWAAVFADVGVSMIAIINSMRTLKGKLKMPSLLGGFVAVVAAAVFAVGLVLDVGKGDIDAIYNVLVIQRKEYLFSVAASLNHPFVL